MNGDADVLHEAMEWLLRLHERSVSEGELVEWTLWYEADERHKRAFEQMQQLWAGAGALAQEPRAHARIGRLLEPARRADARPRGRLALQVALAASVAAVLGLAWLSRRMLSARPPVAARRPLVRRMALPDGTAVELAPGTRLIVRYTSAWRRVILRGGEAYFAVRHDPSRPFIVTASGLTVRDVGTAFNVHEAGGRTVVTVVRGQVEVSPSASPRSGAARADTRNAGVRVSAGEEVRWEHRAGLVVERANTGRALAWRQGRLEYIDEPLSSVIADVDRYARHPVVIGDQAAGRIEFTGTVFTRYADQWVQALPGEFPVRLVSRDGRSFVLESLPDRNP